ncbi:PAS domain S-box protein [Halorubrum sp. SP9]|uniref:PAS domain S-box protein n=2 Tax=unclassified Halorubrum TaxID=2642239 RepID=UPI0010F49CD3|nr:PAS domain S-box protein [Halorubrum sp. SP9]TKX67948.1 PAS domain S-box protein [Halorubrum sp. SP9]
MVSSISKAWYRWSGWSNISCENYFQNDILHNNSFKYMTESTGISILHVDDDSAFAGLTSEMLSKQAPQFTVEIVMSPSEGLERLDTTDFDCIVSDYQMPHQDGIEFLDAVREDYQNLPFILYTGEGSEAVASDAIAAGVTDYLQKGSGMGHYAVLANKIRNAVESYRQRERLQASHDRLRQIIDMLPQLVFVKNEVGEFLLANKATADAYGATVSELEGSTDADFADNKIEVEQFRAADRTVISSGEPTHIPEEQLTTADGNTRVLETTKIPYDPVKTDGKAVLGVSTDITERKEREAELERQSAAMEAAMDGISILNEDLEYTYMNQAHADVFDYDADELLGSSWRRLYGDNETVRIEQEVFPVLESEGEWRGETVGKRCDGTEVYQEVALSLLDDGNVICTNQNITSRKKREQELEQTNTVLRTIVENLPVGVLVEDAKRDVLMANDLLGETLGVPATGDQLIGRDCATAAEELKELFVDPQQFIDDVTNRIERREPVRNEELTLVNGHVVERDYVPYTLPAGDAHLWLYRDITERKQREQELKRSRQFLRDTQEVAHIGGWEFDLQSETLRWSDEVYRIHGLKPDADVTIEDAVEFYHPDDREKVRDAFDRLTTGGEPYNLELRIVTGDGGTRWISTLGEPVSDGDTVVAVQGTFQDITERKAREEELRTVRDQFERFAGNVQDAFFLLPADYSETSYVNPAVRRIYGITPEEAYDDPMAWLRHVHPDDKHELLEQVEAQRSKSPEWPIKQEFRVDHPDRGMRWVRASLDVLDDETGSPSRLAGITTDITEQIEREQQLAAQTEELEQLAIKYASQYRTLFEESPVMTVLTRSEGGRPVIEDCNGQFVDTLGYDADTVIGCELTEFYTSESADKLQSGGYAQSLAGEFTDEKRDLVAADGEITETILRSVPRRTVDGDTVGTVAMYIDISERESVKRTNEQLEEFASVVSHDLRNPLNVATGRLELLSDECDSEHINGLKKALKRMEALIGDLLALAREGKAVTDTQAVNLAALTNECWETVKTNQATLVDNTDGNIQADKSRLKQVFENLFRNAVEHGQTDVTVTVGELANGFYIEDDGQGISPDERDDVFEAGYSQSTDGTGFGLSIVGQIITAHDWQIHVTDGSDGGARFEITDVEFVAS